MNWGGVSACEPRAPLVVVGGGGTYEPLTPLGRVCVRVCAHEPWT